MLVMCHKAQQTHRDQRHACTDASNDASVDGKQNLFQGELAKDIACCRENLRAWKSCCPNYTRNVRYRRCRETVNSVPFEARSGSAKGVDKGHRDKDGSDGARNIDGHGQRLSTTVSVSFDLRFLGVTLSLSS
jgi:hypothetical protein